MPSTQHQAIVDRLLSATGRPNPTLAEMREDYDQILLPFQPVQGTRITTTTAVTVPVDIVVAPGADTGACVVFIHGGGFVLGSVKAYHEYASRISEAAGAAVALIDYRLAPEALAPTAREDCITAYRWLIEHEFDVARTAFIGDSAGGGLALLTAAQLGRSAAPTPSAVVALSPWIDLGVREDMPSAEETGDPMLSVAGLRWFAHTYLGATPGNAPDHNALYADLSGLPATLIQTGTRDITHQDSVLFAERARSAGADVTVEVYPDLIHDWHAYGPELPEGRRALTQVGRFLADFLAEQGAA